MDKFIHALSNLLNPKQIISDELLRYAYATDASLYRMIPQLVLLVNTEYEVQQIINYAHQYKIPLTFRAAGTSLSGQAVTDQVLVVLSNSGWSQYQISANGMQIKLEPGIIGAQANNYLHAYKRKIGPDPGSINSAKIGGIIANNSSGMCCGTSKNSYATLASLRAIFADGSILDTSNERQIEVFKQQHSHLIHGIMHIRGQIMAKPQIIDFIRKKFAIKNTSGYSLNAFLDYQEPIQIIERLLIGSEGTLGFISNVTLNTVPDEPCKALNLIYGNISELCNLTIAIAQYNISSIELLDQLSLQSVRHIKELQPYLLDVDNSSGAIMVELTGANESELLHKLTAVNKIITNSNILHQTGFTQDKAISEILWQARKGVLPTIAGQRPLGSSVLIEDVAVTIEQLARLIVDLRQMFIKYAYSNAAIFGHVLSGNIHFVLTPNFTNPEELHNYELFMNEFTILVAQKYGGSLKAEHGSGRNIAPFAKLEWGDECWNIMWQIKELFDPQNILNPDVKLTRDNTLHLHNLKELPATDAQIDQCMECGFCESVCPSRNLSLTPRQRNAVMRKIVTLDKKQRKIWSKKFTYYGIETCATTGMCQQSCPVGINTGEYMLSLTKPHNKAVNHAKQINQTKNKLNKANMIASIIGKQSLQFVTQKMHNSFKNIPVYLDTTPKTQKNNFTATPSITSGGVMLLPACPNRIFSNSQGMHSYPSQLLLERMGYNVKYPPQLDKQCCGQMYHSQHNDKQQQRSITKLREAVATNELLLIDNSSCANFAKQFDLPTMDINQFVAERIVRSRIQRKFDKIAVHFDCSTTKSNLTSLYHEILNLCAYEIVVPDGIKCCGFAGDKGFTTPELNASSLANLQPQVAGCQIGVSFNRSCQIGLHHHSKMEYMSFIELILYCFK